MKKLMLIAIALFAFTAVSCADNDQPITQEQLPAAAQKFIAKHFPKAEWSYGLLDKEIMGNSYEVSFTDGTKIDFDAKGEWKEVDGQRQAIPTAIVPKEILSYVKAHYPKLFIRKIERDGRGYEVKLDSDFSLKFNSKMKFVSIDD